MRTAAAGAAVVVAVLLALAVVQVVAATARAPFSGGSFPDVERAVTTAGLTVCQTVDEPDPFANQSVATRTYTVSDGACVPGEASLVVDAFADARDRDAAVRALEVRLRPRGSGAVYTFESFAILLRGGTDDAVQDRLDVALRAAGAQ